MAIVAMYELLENLNFPFRLQQRLTTARVSTQKLPRQHPEEVKVWYIKKKYFFWKSMYF